MHQGRRSSDGAPDRTARDDGVYLFVSVDMVNSTAFKNREPRWPFVMHHFFESVVGEIKSVCPRFNVWKYLGDEVTFWRRMQSGDNLIDLVGETHRALGRICAALDAIEDAHGIRTRNIIGAKATMWAASADFVANADLERDLRTSYRHANRIVEEDHLILFGGDAEPQERKAYDFIGPEIDIGFRISHFAQRGFVLLSAALAYLLLQEEQPGDAVEPHMRIVSFEALKGVWGGRKYPIIWYTDRWDDIRDKFTYDEPLESPLIAGICHGDIAAVATVEEILKQTNHLEVLQPARELLRQ
jgi:hypothetical protein